MASSTRTSCSPSSRKAIKDNVYSLCMLSLSNHRHPSAADGKYLYMPLFRIGQFSLSCPPKVSARMKHEGLRTLLVCQRVTCKYNAYNSNFKKPMLCHMLRDSAALYVVSCGDRSAAYSENLCTTPGTNKGSPRFSRDVSADICNSQWMSCQYVKASHWLIPSSLSRATRCTMEWGVMELFSEYCGYDKGVLCLCMVSKIRDSSKMAVACRSR